MLEQQVKLAFLVCSSDAAVAWGLQLLMSVGDWVLVQALRCSHRVGTQGEAGLACPWLLTAL